MGSKTDFIASVMSAMSNCTLYSEQHPIVKELNDKAFSSIGQLCRDGVVSITLLGDSLIFNEEQMSEKGLHVEKFISRLRRSGIDKVIIRSGISGGELLGFISGMAGKRDLQSTSNISLGIVEIGQTTEGVAAKALAAENLERRRRLFEGIRGMHPLDMSCLDDVVAELINTLRNEANVLKVISPIRAHDEYTFIHATNVALLTIFQAESGGITGDLLYEIGFAALLHDVGKMFVPETLLDKKGGLTAEEWDVMRTHPVAGARYLSGLRNVPRLALIAAYEHHMGFDGTGYPDSGKKKKGQHLVSQLVAIADFFDALRTNRPYRKSVGIAEIRCMMAAGAGRQFSPPLLAHFWQSQEGLQGGSE